MTAAAANALLKTLEEPPGRYLSHPRVRSAGTTCRRRSSRAAASSRRQLPAPTTPALGLRRKAWRSPTSCSRKPAGAPLAALLAADPDWQTERRAWVAALADPDRLSVPALAARIETGGQGRAQDASRAGDRLADRLERGSRARRCGRRAATESRCGASVDGDCIAGGAGRRSFAIIDR